MRVVAAAALALMLLALVNLRAVAPPPAPAAIEISYAIDATLPPLITLALPTSPHDAAHYVARSRGAQGGRWDTLTFGEWDADVPFLLVTLRQDAAAPAPVSLFVDLAMQSAEFGAAVLRSASPETFVGAHGPVEWAQANLSDAKGERSCIGFRFRPAGANRVSGLACGVSDIRLERAKLECLIDALSLTQAGLDAGLGAVLPGAASRRAACAHSLT